MANSSSKTHCWGDVRRVATGMAEAMVRPIVVLDDKLQIVAANIATCELLGCSREQLLDRSLFDYAVPQMPRDRFTERLCKMPAAEGVFHSFEAEIVVAGSQCRTWLFNARQVTLEVTASRLILLAIEDTTVAEQDSAELADYQKKVRSLTTVAALADESRRRQIAVDLHDGAVQTLALLRRRLGAIRHQTDNHEAGNRVDQCVELVDVALNQTRKLTNELSPPILYDLGLSPALDWLVNRFRNEHELNVALIATSESLSLSRSVQVICFRAVRELLWNAVKYAPDSEVIVTVGSSEDSVEIMVRDTGPGFEPSRLGVRVDGSLGFGLVSVHEQVRGIGGEVEFHSLTGEGTRIKLIVPVGDA